MSFKVPRLRILRATLLVTLVTIVVAEDHGLASSSAPLKGQTVRAIADLPDGDYWYVGAATPDPRATRSGKIEVFFRKAGKWIVSRAIVFADGNGCFRGELRQNTVYKVVLAEEPGRRGGPWKFLAGPTIDLSRYHQQTEPLPDYGKAAIRDCLQVYRQER